MPISASFTVEGSSNPNEHIVAYDATVDLALVSIVGADVIAWEILSASEPGTAIPTITLGGTPLGSTASFVMVADPSDDIGRSFHVKCTVSNANEIAIETAVVGAANINGILPLLPGEELERHATHGWGPVINRLLATGGGGPTSLGGDVTGATSANTVVRIRGATVTVAGAVGTVLQVIGANALGYDLVALSSIAQSSATTGQVPVWNGSAWAPGTATATGVTPGTARQIYFTNAVPSAAWVTASGDVTVPTTAGVFVVERINGATVPAAGALTTGYVLQVSGASALTYGLIGPGSIDPGAAIQGQALIFNGTAWAPGNDFYARNVVTTGTLGAGATTVTGLTISGLSTGVLHSGVAGAVTSSLIVDADVDDDAGIVTTKLGQTGATTGQAIVWSGTDWIPGTPGVGTGSITPGTAGQILVTLAGPSTAWATAAGDWTGAVGSNVVERINGATVPAAGALTPGHYLVVNGASSLGYAALPNSASSVQLVADMPALEALSVTALPDRCMCIVQTPTRLYWLDKSATPAASGDDELPPANGGGAWRFKEAA